MHESSISGEALIAVMLRGEGLGGGHNDHRALSGSAAKTLALLITTFLQLPAIALRRAEDTPTLSL